MKRKNIGLGPHGGMANFSYFFSLGSLSPSQSFIKGSRSVNKLAKSYSLLKDFKLQQLVDILPHACPPVLGAGLEASNFLCDTSF